MSTVMSHQTAEKTGVAERYLLGDTGPDERAAFEAHYFDCRVCAEQVRIGAIFADNAEAVMRAAPAPVAASWPRERVGWRTWFRPLVLAPAFATLVLGFVVSYQNLVTLPALRAPQLLSEMVIAPAAREAGPAIAIDRHRPMFNARFAVDSVKTYPEYTCTFAKEDGTTILAMESGQRDVSSFTLGALLPAARFPDGAYSMILRPRHEPSLVIQRYNFTIRSGE